MINPRLTKLMTGMIVALSLMPIQSLELAAEPNISSRHPPALGVAVTPRNFPNHTAEDVESAFRITRQLGRYMVFIAQWSRIRLSTINAVMGKARERGLVPIIGLSPTTLDQHRAGLDLPADVRRRAGRYISFANPVIRRAFKQTAIKLAQFKPPYLSLATEINFLVLRKPKEYLHFVSLYKETYRLIKRISPKTKVFVSFQWEIMRILDAKAPRRTSEHSKLINIFRPELDVIGLTSYPSPFHKTPARLPKDYYTRILRHIPNGDEVLLMEIGWPTKASGSEAEQADFIRRLPGLLRGVNVSVIAWALLHDVNLSEFNANLNTTGLITRRGRKKPGYFRFRDLYK